MKVLKFLFSIALFCHKSWGLEITIPDLITSSVDLVKGVVASVPKNLPSSENIIEVPKNALIGIPSALITSVADGICSTALAEDAVHPRITPNITKMELQLRTACDIEYFHLLEADKISESSIFDPEKLVVVIVSGWISNPQSDVIKDLAKSFICRNDSNVVVLDNADYVNSLYTWSAYNTEEIGENLAKSLVKLTTVVPAKNIHLVGHSLGAQIVGAAGRYFQKQSGQKLSHITGLDPAKPCFNQGQALTGVFRGNADFIDIFHSNPYVLGQPQAVGDVDYYPGGIYPIKPGCLLLGNFCSHERAWAYYAESVYPNNKKNFLGIRCTSLNDLRADKCEGESRVMGYAVSHDLKGIFFSEVNAEEPYGTNASEDFQSSSSSCSACQES